MPANLYANALVEAFNGSLALIPVSPPQAPSVTPEGTTGSTTYEYVITALLVDAETTPSPIGSTTTGNATLSATNYNAISWAGVVGASSYNVYRLTAGVFELIGNTTATTFDDTGQAPSTQNPPTTNGTSNPVYFALVDSTYVPSLTSNSLWQSGEPPAEYEVSGPGYTAGGVLLSNPALTLTPASDWSIAWAASTTYAVGTVIAVGSLLYRVIVAGTSGSTAPTWSTVEGETTVDGGVTWTTLGDAVLVFTSGPASWNNLTVEAAYGVIYADPYLLVLETFSNPISTTDQDLTIEPDPNLGWFCFSPPS